jgi:TetR/AcrR family transcriptional repressor of lmrAB and yxaGH operons
MRPTKLAEKQVLRRLTEVFRERGYEGASYALLMAATGLVKASLYHRFPGGKEEMVDAVLSQVDREFLEYVLRPAREAGPPEKRVRQMARRLRQFYRSGNRWCLLDTLTLASSARTLGHARRSMEFWIDSFAGVARQAGMSRALARRRAEDAVAAIEGGLIVSRVLKNRRPFLRALATLPGRLTRAAGTGRRDGGLSGAF